MGLSARLERLIPDLSATVLRFPVAAVIAVGLCLYLNIAGASSDADGQVIAGASAAFIAAGAAHLFAEGRAWPRLTGLMLAVLVAAVAGALGAFSGNFATNLVFLFAGLIPLLMIAPYLRSGAEQGAIWLFNLRLGLAALLSSVVALLFALGLSAIVEALNILFGAGLGDLHEHIWFTAMALVAPLYGLSLMPRDLGEVVDVMQQKGSLLDRGISVLVNYVAVPVIVVYTLILHAYALKIIVEGELPKGQIGTMVTIFAIGGTAAWLVAWPWREQGTKLLRLFMRSWFFLLVVPAVLLAVAIWRRLSDYGVTPDRYGIALVAVWVAALAVYLALRRNRADMRAILGGMALLLLVGSVGPLGANGLTVSSQFARLKDLLAKAGVLKDGKIAAKGLLGADAASTGNSIIYALKDVDGLDLLRPWFDGEANDPFIAKDNDDWVLAQALTERLGFNQATLSPDYVNFNANKASSIEVPPGARLLGPFQALSYANTPPHALEAIYDSTQVRITLNGNVYTVSQLRILEEAKARTAQGAASQSAITIEIYPGLTMVIDNLNGNFAATPPVSGLRFWIIQQQQP
jgi:Domain of unknown function (DUF4153)